MKILFFILFLLYTMSLWGQHQAPAPLFRDPITDGAADPVQMCIRDRASVVKGNKYVDAVREAVKNEKAEVLIIGAGIEADIAELETYEEKQLFLEDLGLKEAGVNKLIRTAYHLLNLQTYFTAGPKEVRAWTFRKGMKAPQTAGKMCIRDRCRGKNEN